MTNKPHRIHTFDLLRGLAVLTMMLAHSVYFFHSRNSTVLLNLENFGNTVSFVTFLLVSGAVSFVAYFGRHQAGQPVNRRRVFSRILLLAFAYYVLAFVLTGPDLIRTAGFARLRLVLDILSFRHLPGFTEYFPPFIFYSALLAFLPRLFYRASRSLPIVILISLLAYGAGWLLYSLPAGSFQPWLALLAGAQGLYRFPLLQYLPVFLLGLYWGHRTVATESLVAKRQFVANSFWFFAYVAMAGYAISYLKDIPLATIFSRWPPTVPFLALGLGFAFLAATALYGFRQLRSAVILRDLLLVFGQNALGLFWSHIFLLGLYASANGSQVSSLALFAFLFILLVVLSLALTTFLPFNFRLALTSARGSREEQEEQLEREAVFQLSKDVAAEATGATRGFRRILKRRHRLGLSLLALVTAVLIFPSTTQELALQRQERGANVWWSNTYAYRQLVTLTNPESFITLQPGTPVALHFNHKILVEQGKSTADGRDIQIVYWTGENHFVAERMIENPDSDQTTIKFRLPVKLEGGQADQFYALYYGSFITATPSTATVETGPILQSKFEAEQAYPLVASVSTTWSLIGQPTGDSLTFHLTTNRPHRADSATYQILDTSVTGTMLPSSETSWEATVPVNTLPPGTYRIQATLHDGNRQETSQLAGFYRSYPLYVAWTFDWEGYDVNQTYLDAMELIAEDFHLPMTQFFNPRIYVTKTINPARAKALTEWVQRRLQLGDGYGLHLHMLTDFVEHAGVTPRAEPNWGDRGDGYGVPLSAYTEEEQQTMIAHGLDLLSAHALPRATIFRAGGWYANLDTLAALENLGFSVDSSSRTAYKFGRNQLPGFWNILATTHPYYPSRTNQNVPATTNAFRVLEIPDNGADSYAFSAQAMIDRFTANLGDGILKDKQQITYLTHPHWFDAKEQQRIRDLFTYISRYTFSDDRGPVIFTTTNAIATLWQ